MRRFAALLFTALFAALPAAAKIIGGDDLRPVNDLALNLPGHLRHIPDAVGLIRPMGCTGTHIGNGYVITAAHCFMQREGDLKDQPCPENTMITWGYRAGRDLETIFTSRCTRVFAMKFSDRDADWAIFKVDRAPRAFVGIDRNARPQVGQLMTIFSHPDMKPLQWSRVCRVERAIPMAWGPKWIYHRCDTNPGSSGAALIDATTGLIVGVHSGGDDRYNMASFLPLQF